jgi:hypothetical protein
VYQGIGLNSSQGKLLKVILASLILHALVLYLFARKEVFSSNASVSDNTAATPVEPIEARLMFPPIPTNNDIKDELQALATQPLVQHQEDTPPEVKPEVNVSKKPTAPLPALAPTLAPVAAPGNTEENNNQPALHTTNTAALAKKHMSSFQQDQLDSLAQKAARTYQRQKNSPVLRRKKIDPFVTEDEKFQASNRIKVNCNSGTNKAAAALSYFFGGSLKCSQPPKINTFIQDRLNKKMHLPAKYENEEQQ